MKVKQTAANNVVIARVKREYNHLIFPKFSLIYNQDGPDAARVYIGQFTRAERRTAAMDELFREAPGGEDDEN